MIEYHRRHRPNSFYPIAIGTCFIAHLWSSWSEGASKSFSGMPYISCPMGFAINRGRLWGQKISVVVCIREGHHGNSCFNQGLMSIG